MTKKNLFAVSHLFILGLFGALSITQLRAANPFIHKLFSSNMVLQRDANDPIWGWVTPGITVTVTVKDQNFATLQTTNAVADADGHWEVSVGPFGLVPNNAAYTIIISAPGQTTMTLTNVLIGDVWLCSGQSNMAFPMTTIGVINTPEEVADSINYTNIRCFTVPLTEATTPQTNLPSGSWIVVGPGNAASISATGYFTAREIYKRQNIPIGIVCSAWGGTEIECWVNSNFGLSVSDFMQPYFDQTLQSDTRSVVSYLYNAMIAPLAPFRFKAVEWYQGEYNVANPEQYSRMLPGLMNTWRSYFGQANLPFIIIQLPNFSGAQTKPVETGSWAELREAELKTVLNDTNSRIVSTIDIGQGNLHPTDKQDVGLRAAWAAADLVYGQNVVDECPICTEVLISGTNIICTFTNIGAGLMIGFKDAFNPLSPVVPTNAPLVNFAIAGANKTFFAANATITASNKVTVWSSSVPSPLYVRFGWGNNPPCNLYNQIVDGGQSNGIPASPFRNDPVNKLMVNLGNGTGYYASNATVSITASNLTGETFDHWSGDTNFLSDITATTVTATQKQEYVSVLANFRITSAPTGLMVASAAGQVTLTWNPMVATHYNVKRSTVNGGPYMTIITNLIGNPSYSDASVTVGSTYYYVVSATNIMNEGPDSTQVSVTVSAAPPHNFTNIWDANGIIAPNPSDGSGTWLTASNWWDGTTNLNGNWSTSPLDSAQFGAGTPGSYTINLGGGTIGASNVVFATSGYTLTNGTLSLASAGPITVNAGVVATVNSVANPGYVSVGSRGILNLGGGTSGFLNNASAGSTGAGTVVLVSPSAKSFTVSGNPSWNIGDPVGLTGGLVVSNNSTFSEAGSFVVGGAGSAGLVTINSPSAVYNVTGTGATLLGRYNNANTRGRLRLINGLLNAGFSTGIRVGYQLGSASATSEFDIMGGTYVQSNPLLILENSTLATATVNMSGGTAMLGGISFGNGSSSGTANFTMSGGTMYLSSGGILNLGNNSFAATITLSGGTIGANTNWSSAMPMTLNGNITFQTADTNNYPKNITLGGTLSGSHGLIKTGGGTLNLTGTNTYTGGTTINAGTLAMTTMNSLMAYTNNGAIMNIKLTSVGSTLPASGVVFNGSRPQITFDLAGLGNTTRPVFNCGNLAMNANVSVNVSNAPINGTSVLMTYGARTGAGNFVAGTIPASASIIDDSVNKRVMLTYLPATPPTIQKINHNGSQFNFSGSNGAAFSTYRILKSTNLAEDWWPVFTNQFDGVGVFTSSIPIDSGEPDAFFRLVTP